MEPLTNYSKFVMNLTVVNSLWTKKLDTALIDIGLNLNEFMVLYQLSVSPDEKMRRVDLADKLGLTASGITRVLAPIEKLGMVRREANARDARVSYVKLTNVGKRNMNEASLVVEQQLKREFRNANFEQFIKLNYLLVEMGGTFA